MDGFLSFLLFALLFYVMMRFGCGAHIVHGHRGGQQPGAGGKHVDPVCDKPVDPNEGYGKMHAGRLYRFCSRHCLDMFEADPERYSDKKARNAPGHAGWQ